MQAPKTRQETQEPAAYPAGDGFPLHGMTTEEQSSLEEIPSRELNIEFIKPEWTLNSVAELLKCHCARADDWSTIALQNLATEVATGKARFCKRGDELWRLVDIVVVLLIYEPEDLVIQEVSHPAYKRNFKRLDSQKNISFDGEFDDNDDLGPTWVTSSMPFQPGALGKVPEKTVKGRLCVGEGMIEGAKRCLDEKLEFATEGLVEIKPDLLETRESADYFAELPGLGSLTRMHVMQARVDATKKEDLEKFGIPDRALSVAKYEYQWQCISGVRHVKKHFKAKGRGCSQPDRALPPDARGMVLDHYNVPVMPWSKAEIESVLESYGVNPSESFGLKTEELHRELLQGRISLGLLRGSAMACAEGSITGQSVEKAQVRLVCVSETLSMIASRSHQELACAPPFSGDSFRSNSTLSDLSAGIAQVDTPEAVDENVDGFREDNRCVRSTRKWANESVSLAILRLSQQEFKLATPRLKMSGCLLATVDTIGGNENVVYRESIVHGPWKV